MSTARINGVEHYYEETGSGYPLVWCHEFGGDYRSWEPQVRYFSRRYRVITWNYRGYPPSGVPKDEAAYRNEILVDDLAGLLRHLEIERAHVGGLSMGGNVTLNFGIKYPQMSRSLIICACGSGTVGREDFLAREEQYAQLLIKDGINVKARHCEGLATRRGFAEKDPRGWKEFLQQLGDHSAVGSAYMLRGVQMKRKTIFDLEHELKRLDVPSLIVVGDQDEACLDPGLFMKRHIPYAGLLMLPMTGHTSNIEEPGLFNLHVSEFLAAVENGRWGPWKAEKVGMCLRAQS